MARNEELFVVKVDWKPAAKELARMEQRVEDLTKTLEQEFNSAEAEIVKSLGRIGTAAETALDVEVSNAFKEAIEGSSAEADRLTKTLKELIQEQLSFAAALAGTEKTLEATAAKTRNSADTLLAAAVKTGTLTDEQGKLLTQTLAMVKELNNLVAAYKEGSKNQDTLQQSQETFRAGLEKLLPKVRELSALMDKTEGPAIDMSGFGDFDDVLADIEAFAQANKAPDPVAAPVGEDVAEATREATEEVRELTEAVEDVPAAAVKAAEEIKELSEEVQKVPDPVIEPVVDTEKVDEAVKEAVQQGQLKLPIEVEPAGKIIDEERVTEDLARVGEKAKEVKEEIAKPQQMSLFDHAATTQTLDAVEEKIEEVAQPVTVPLTPVVEAEEVREEIQEAVKKPIEMPAPVVHDPDTDFLEDFAKTAAGALETQLEDALSVIDEYDNREILNLADAEDAAARLGVRLDTIAEYLTSLSPREIGIDYAMEQGAEKSQLLINRIQEVRNRLEAVGEGGAPLITVLDEVARRLGIAVERQERMVSLSETIKTLDTAGISTLGMDDTDILPLFDRLRESVTGMSEEWRDFLTRIADFDLPITDYLTGIDNADAGVKKLIDSWRELNDLGVDRPARALLRLKEELEGVDDAANARTNIDDKLDKMGKEAEDAAEGMGEMSESLRETMDLLRQLGKGGIGAWEKTMQLLGEPIIPEDQPTRLMQLALATKEVNQQMQQTGPTVNAATAAWRLLLTQFPEFTGELQRVADRYRGLKVTIGDNSEITDQREEFDKLLQKYPLVRNELDRLIARYGQLTVQVDKSNKVTKSSGGGLGGRVGGFLSSIGGGGGPLGGALAGLGKLAVGGSVVGAAIGGITALVKITDRLFESVIRVVEQGWERLKETIAASVQEARKFESVQASFESVIASFGADAFGGHLERAADMFGNRLGTVLALEGRRFSEKFGVDVTDSWRRILTQVGDVDLAGQFLQAIPGLRAAAPDLSPARSGLALIEAMAQDFEPLRRAFELPISDLREAAKASGDLRDIAEALNNTLGELGLGFEAQQETYIVQVGRLTEAFKTLQILLGTNVLKELQNQLPRVTEALGGQRTQIYELVEAVGVFVSNGVAILGDALVFVINSGFIEFLTGVVKAATTFVNWLARAAQAVIAFVGLGEGLDGLARKVDGLAGFFGKIANIISFIANPLGIFKDQIRELVISLLDGLGVSDEMLDRLRTYFDEGQSMLTRLQAGWEFLTQTVRKFHAELIEAQTLFNLLDDVAFTDLTLEEAKEQAIEAADAFLQLSDSLDERMVDRMSRLEETADSLTEAFTETSEEALKVAAAILTIQEAQRASEESEADILAILEKYNKQVEDAEDRHLEALEDAKTDHLRRQLKLEQDAAQDRIDMMRDYYRDLEDLATGYEHDLIDALTDLNRKLSDIDIDIDRDIEDAGIENRRDIEDAYTDYVRKIEDIDRDSVDKRIGIEIDYWEDIRKIREKFEEEIEEALRRNDAVAFMRARRKAAQELEDAKRKRDKELKEEADDREKKRREAAIDRDRELQDIAKDLEREREDIARNEDRKRQDAKQDYARKLEDLALALARRKAELELNLRREEKDIAESNERKRRELEASYQDQLDDLELAFDRRKTEIQNSLDEERAVFDEKEKQKLIAMQNAIDTLSLYSAEQLAVLAGFSEEAAQIILDQVDNLRDVVARRRQELGIIDPGKYGMPYPSEPTPWQGPGTNPYAIPGPNPYSIPEPVQPPPEPEPVEPPVGTPPIPPEIYELLPERYGDLPLPAGWAWTEISGRKLLIALTQYGQLYIPYNEDGSKPTIPGFKDGGTTPVRRPYIVGENGPELRFDNRSHFISTIDDFLDRLYMNNVTPAHTAPSYQYNNEVTAEIVMADLTKLSLHQQAEVRNIVTNMLKEALSVV